MLGEDGLKRVLKDGGMAEWFKAAVLKTASPKGDVGSNPTPSATNHVGFVASKATSKLRVRSPSFNSLNRRDAREAEGARLLSEYPA